MCQNSRIEVADIGLISSSPHVFTDREIVSLDEFDRRYILDVLNTTNYQIKGPGGAAKLLGVPPSTLYGKMKRLGIKLNR